MTVDARLAAAIRGAFDGEAVSDETLAELAALFEKDPGLAPSEADMRAIERRAREIVGEYRRRVRVAVGSLALVVSAVFTTTLYYREGHLDGWFGFAAAGTAEHSMAAHGTGVAGRGHASPPPAAPAPAEAGPGFMGVGALAAASDSGADIHPAAPLAAQPPVVVLVDGDAVYALGWPVPPRAYAAIVDRLAGARAVVLDVDLAGLSDTPGVEALAAAIRRHGRVVLGAVLDTAAIVVRETGRSIDLAMAKIPSVKAIGRMSWVSLPEPSLLEAAAGVGAVNVGEGAVVGRGRRAQAVPTLGEAVRGLVGKTQTSREARPAAGNRWRGGEVETIPVAEVFRDGGERRLAGRVVYVGATRIAGGEMVMVDGEERIRMVMLASR